MIARQTWNRVRRVGSVPVTAYRQKGHSSFWPTRGSEEECPLFPQLGIVKETPSGATTNAASHGAIRIWQLLVLCALAVLVATGALAQRGRRGYGDRRGYDGRAGVPDWEVDKEFSQDVFTFVRIQYSSGYGGRSYGGGYGRGYGRRGGYGYSSGGDWRTDYPDSDLNFSYRLHQLTSMEVNPDGLVLELTDPELVNYPFIYMLECGRLVFSDEEIEALRRYLLNGGFLMVDDFWGDDEWFNFYSQIKRVFPDREPIELSIDHPIFHMVFDLKEKPQIPSINVALAGRPYGITWESRPDRATGKDTAEEVHFKAIYDDQGRMMAIICHNTDLGDGWEREGEDEWYFHEFSEKKAYPMGINIVVYAMTH